MSGGLIRFPDLVGELGAGGADVDGGANGPPVPASRPLGPRGLLRAARPQRHVGRPWLSADGLDRVDPALQLDALEHIRDVHARDVRASRVLVCARRDHLVGDVVEFPCVRPLSLRHQGQDRRAALRLGRIWVLDRRLDRRPARLRERGFHHLKRRIETHHIDGELGCDDHYGIFMRLSDYRTPTLRPPALNDARGLPSTFQRENFSRGYDQ